MDIGGIADESLTGIVPPYFTGSTAGRTTSFTRQTIDDLCAAPRMNGAAPANCGVLSLGEYRGELRRAIHQMKFRNARWITARFGRNLGLAFRAKSHAWSPHVVTWAPTTKRRARRRGHDQSSILATSVARAICSRKVRSLRRTDDRAQTGSPRETRLRGPQYVARAGAVRGRRVLLVDDVMTTGTTLARARDALLAAGAAEVRCAVIAHVPRARQ